MWFHAVWRDLTIVSKEPTSFIWGLKTEARSSSETLEVLTFTTMRTSNLLLITVNVCGLMAKSRCTLQWLAYAWCWPFFYLTSKFIQLYLTSLRTFSGQGRYSIQIYLEFAVDTFLELTAKWVMHEVWYIQAYVCTLLMNYTLIFFLFTTLTLSLTSLTSLTLFWTCGNTQR